MKHISAILSFFILVLGIFWSLYSIMPRDNEFEAIPKEEFSTERAFQHVKEIAQEPHYVGSENHSQVRNYIVNQLQEMGLFVQTQTGFSLNKYGIATKPENIISKIEGTTEGKSLLLLTHYDSAMHSSFGASDAASGVATILEGVRAFLAKNEKPENDIILVFTDAEELGLNGAELFVREHPWAMDIGLALNFESRGSGGSSFMLLETTDGNAELIENFIEANPEYPVTNSLAYSIYKMLPNDTDLTVLREKGEINGFNFAFIDDHFDYHTATDIPENLDLNTLAHQGSYIMPLLQYFANADLSNLKSEENSIYFNFPILEMFSYPYGWIFPLLILTFLIFAVVLFLGLKKEKLALKDILNGFLPLLLSLILAGGVVFLFWKACLMLYPQYNEMEHGFTYNGYKYIAAAVFLALGITFLIYKKFRKSEKTASYFVAPLFLWLLLSTGAAFYLKGASYFVIPVLFGLLQMFLLLKYKKPSILILSVLSLPAIFIVMPFVMKFPVALGLQILFVAAIMAVLLVVLFLPIFFFWKKTKTLGILCWTTAFIFFVLAHFEADFNEARPKPNSLVYILDANKKTATWNTYDELLDSWTEDFIDQEAENVVNDHVFSSKYSTGLSYKAPAPLVDLQEPEVFLSKNDTSENGNVFYNLKIVPQRNINRIDFFADKNFDFQNIKVNEKEADSVSFRGEQYHVFKDRLLDNLITYYAVNRDTLDLQIEVRAGEHPTIEMYETSYTLLEDERFPVPERPADMIPRPFVINDAVIVKKEIKLE